MKRLVLLAACSALGACGGTQTRFISDVPVNIVGLDPNAVIVPIDQSDLTPPSGDINDDFDTLINGVRFDAGSGPVAFDARLGSAAQDYAELMLETNHFGHVGPDGSRLQDRVAATGYDYAVLRENIAGGEPNVGAVFNAWQGSELHLANNLAGDVEDFGLGFASEGRNNRWVLILGSER